jgi:hypothetical protein
MKRTAHQSWLVTVVVSSRMMRESEDKKKVGKIKDLESWLYVPWSINLAPFSQSPYEFQLLKSVCEVITGNHSPVWKLVFFFLSLFSFESLNFAHLFFFGGGAYLLSLIHSFWYLELSSILHITYFVFLQLPHHTHLWQHSWPCSTGMFQGRKWSLFSIVMNSLQSWPQSQQPAKYFWTSCCEKGQKCLYEPIKLSQSAYLSAHWNTKLAELGRNPNLQPGLSLKASNQCCHMSDNVYVTLTRMLWVLICVLPVCCTYSWWTLTTPVCH